MCLYESNDFSGTIKECDEGVLEWIKISELLNLKLWEGDKIFLKLMQDNERSFFSLKLIYNKDGILTEAVLDGNPIENR